MIDWEFFKDFFKTFGKVGVSRNSPEVQDFLSHLGSRIETEEKRIVHERRLWGDRYIDAPELEKCAEYLESIYSSLGADIETIKYWRYKAARFHGHPRLPW